MEIVCPACSSKFNLPDAVAKPGIKLRCSVCKDVFVLPAAPPPPPPAPAGEAHDAPLSMPKPVRSKKRLIILFAALSLLAGSAAGGAWWFFAHNRLQSAAPQNALPLAQKVEKLTMLSVRQYFVKNEKLGMIAVVEGKVVNGFPSPKELIEVEAALYGQDKNPLVVKRQLAGTFLSPFQMQALGEKELETFTHNKLDVLANNTDIPPGGEVPFMILFYNPPASVAEFRVKVVDVREPEIKK